MIILRFVALILLVAGLLLLGADIFGSYDAGGGFPPDSFRSIEGAWGTVHPGSLESAGGNVPGVLMTSPASLVLGGLGVVLAFLFRRRD